jgi:cytochrome c553
VRIVWAVPVAGAALVLVAAWAPRSPAQDPSGGFRFCGSGGCGTKDCHGSPAPKESPALNEYLLWKEKDKHAKAFLTLYRGPSKEIGKKLGIDKPHEAPACLACHSQPLEKERLAEKSTWSIRDGVSCESCHGPAEKWFEAHSKPAEGARAKYLTQGMADLRDPAVWAATCAGCHLKIDGKLIEAGHPRLLFEWSDYSERMPPHWLTAKHPAAQPEFRAKGWAVGQAVSLAAALRNLAARIRAGESEGSIAEARQVAASHYRVLMPEGVRAEEIAETDADKLEATAERAGKVAASPEGVLARLASEPPPSDFAGARQVALAFRALGVKPEAKADVDRLCALVAPSAAGGFDAAKFAGDFAAVAAHFKR